jgi:hypothetical protein
MLQGSYEATEGRDLRKVIKQLFVKERTRTENPLKRINRSKNESKKIERHNIQLHTERDELK